MDERSTLKRAVHTNGVGSPTLDVLPLNRQIFENSEKKVSIRGKKAPSEEGLSPKRRKNMSHTNDDRVPVVRYLVIAAIFAVIVLLTAFHAFGAGNGPGISVEMFGKAVPVIPIMMFVSMLLGILFLHDYNVEVALGGLAALMLYNAYTGDAGYTPHMGEHFVHEAGSLLNLGFMIAGFAVLAKTFEESKLGDAMPRWLPDDWRGGAMLICMVCVMSAFLDNIAACLIGGVVAKEVFKDRKGRTRLTVGYIAALVMASNLGGAPSPIGDTTTIMIVNAGIPSDRVLAGVPGVMVGCLVLAYFAGRQQDAHQRILKDEAKGTTVNLRIVMAVIVTLIFVIIGTLTIHLTSVGVWAGLIVAGAFAFHHIPWREGWAHSTVRSSLFLVALVACASLMPKFLPAPSWGSTLGLGVMSAFFDNIPLTDLAIRQGGFIGPCWLTAWVRAVR